MTKYPDIWYKDLQEKTKQSECLRIEMIARVEDALENLRRKYRWDRAYIFGSVIRANKFHAGSDIDIALSGLNKLELYAVIGEISAILDRDVDVVRLEECPFHESIMNQGIQCKPKSN